MTDAMLKTVTKSALIMSLPFIFQACGNGPATESNPFVEDNGLGGSTYTGPPPESQAIKDFQDTVWAGLRSSSRCGSCHGTGTDLPFVDESDVNEAYTHAIGYINLDNPGGSGLVSQVEGSNDPSDGHFCWSSLDVVCADTVELLITRMSGETDNTESKQIDLSSPTIRNPGESKNFPDSATEGSPSFATTIYPLLRDNCGNCHYEQGVSQQQAPFFSNPNDTQSSYEAAKPKINIDVPNQSRLVLRLNEGHNCWTDCVSDANEMRLEIEAFAGGITAQPVNSALVTSKALTLADGIIASGGSRHEADAIALYEFKEGSGDTVSDTSGIEPAMDLRISNPASVSWLSNYGLDFTGGRAQASTTNSDKIYQYVQTTGEYSIEAWVIPANVTQEDATIAGYGPGGESINFALSQTLYNYNFFNRTVNDSMAGDYLSTEDAGELAQSAQQHVVVTYSVVEGRKVYLNGELVDVADPITESTQVTNWDSTWAFVLGANQNGGQNWEGKIRLVAVHSAVLTDAQIAQNFEAGVGEKYFLLFSVSEQLDDAGITGCFNSTDSSHQCFVMMEASRYDDYSYLFDSPTFINIDSDWTPPSSFIIEGLRIAVNGREAVAGQEFGHVRVSIDSGNYTAGAGTVLAQRGAVIELEKGPESDEFFVTFEVLAGDTNFYVDALPTAPTPPADAEAVSDIGVRTFDEINAAIAKVTGVSVNNSNVNSVFQQYRRQLPAIESIDAFLSSHQMAIAQLALTSCGERVDADAALPIGNPGRVRFSDFDFSLTADQAFDTPTQRSNAIDPILDALLLTNLNSQPDQTEVADSLGAATSQSLTSGSNNYAYNSLITEMSRCPIPGDPHYNEDFPCNTGTDINTAARTAEIVKALCAAAVGSAAMLIQ